MHYNVPVTHFNIVHIYAPWCFSRLYFTNVRACPFQPNEFQSVISFEQRFYLIDSPLLCSHEILEPNPYQASKLQAQP